LIENLYDVTKNMYNNDNFYEELVIVKEFVNFSVVANEFSYIQLQHMLEIYDHFFFGYFSIFPIHISIYIRIFFDRILFFFVFLRLSNVLMSPFK
jgi:hypothetical protein